MIFRGLFQPRMLHDSMILWLHINVHMLLLWTPPLWNSPTKQVEIPNHSNADGKGWWKVFSPNLLLKAHLCSGHAPCYSHEIKLSKAVHIDLHNLNYTYIVGQAPSAAFSSPLSSLIDLPGFTASSFWRGYLFRKTNVGRESPEHKSIYPKKCCGVQRDKDFSAHCGELLYSTQ